MVGQEKSYLIVCYCVQSPAFRYTNRHTACNVRGFFLVFTWYRFVNSTPTFCLLLLQQGGVKLMSFDTDCLCLKRDKLKGNLLSTCCFENRNRVVHRCAVIRLYSNEGFCWLTCRQASTTFSYLNGC